MLCCMNTMERWQVNAEILSSQYDIQATIHGHGLKTTVRQMQNKVKMMQIQTFEFRRHPLHMDIDLLFYVYLCLLTIMCMSI